MRKDRRGEVERTTGKKHVTEERKELSKAKITIRSEEPKWEAFKIV